MNNDTARARHAEHELERAMHARALRLAAHEREVRARERARVLALVAPWPREDDTGFVEGGWI